MSKIKNGFAGDKFMIGFISNYDSYNEYYDWLKKLNNEYDAMMSI